LPLDLGPANGQNRRDLAVHGRSGEGRLFYTDEGVQRCLNAGVRSIEHGNFMSRETMARIANAGAFYDPTFISLAQRIETAGETNLPIGIVENLRRTIDRGKQVYAWAKELGVPIALGTDLWGPDAQKSQPREFEQRVDLDSSRNVLRSATVVNAELLMHSGMLGTIAPGAYADLLVVDGNPLSDIRVLVKPERTLKLIMKGGVIYKNDIVNTIRSPNSGSCMSTFR
jgi:imidazolonepropionase-like amidohydrolase